MGDDFILQFEFDKRNEWRVLRKSIIYHLGIICGFLYYFLTDETFGLFIGYGFLIVSAPQILLHLHYKLNDKNKIITVNYSKRTIKIEIKGVINNELQFSDIKKITRRKGQNDEDNHGYVLPISFYHHTRIQLKNGQTINFSDFVAKDIGIRGLKTEEKITFLNLMI